MVALQGGNVGLHAPVQKLAVLRLGGRLIVKWIGAAVVVELVFAEVRVDGQQGVRIEGVLIARRNAPGEHTLPLILGELVVAVGNLNGVAGGEEVQMENVDAVGLVVEAVEQRLVVAAVVDVDELGGVQETVAAVAVGGQEVAHLGIAESNSHAAGDGGERAVGDIRVAEQASGAQGGARGHVGHQAGFIPELRPGRSGGQFHALDGAGGKLRGEDLALLIADGLSVDDEADLRVVAQGVEEAVAIGRHAAGAVSDGLAQTRAGIAEGKLGQGAEVGIHVGGGGELEHIGSRGLHRDAGLLAGQSQGSLNFDGDGVAHVDVLRVHLEAGHGDRHVVGIRRDVDQPERAVFVGGSGLLVTGQRIVDGDGSPSYDRAGLVGNGSFDGAGVPQRLAEGGAERQQGKQTKTQSSSHGVQYPRQRRPGL